MSLIYRGQKAQLSSVANTVETNHHGQFLGASFSFRAPQQSVHSPAATMTYRGVSY